MRNVNLAGDIAAIVILSAVVVSICWCAVAFWQTAVSILFAAFVVSGFIAAVIALCWAVERFMEIMGWD